MAKTKAKNIGMSGEEKGLLARANEIVDNAQVILDDMKKNRTEYNSKDLAWRCIDMVNVQNSAIKALLMAIEGKEIILKDKDDDEETNKNDSGDKRE